MNKKNSKGKREVTSVLEKVYSKSRYMEGKGKFEECNKLNKRVWAKV